MFPRNKTPRSNHITWPFANSQFCFEFGKFKGPKRRDGYLAAKAHRCKKFKCTQQYSDSDATASWVELPTFRIQREKPLISKLKHQCKDIRRMASFIGMEFRVKSRVNWEIVERWHLFTTVVQSLTWISWKGIHICLWLHNLWTSVGVLFIRFSYQCFGCGCPAARLVWAHRNFRPPRQIETRQHRRDHRGVTIS